VNVLSLCSGYGGIELGLQIATKGAARTICFVEREAYLAVCLATRMQEGNLRPACIHSDLRTFDGSPWRPAMDRGVLAAGIPCQPFSTADSQYRLTGNHPTKDDPRRLWSEVLRVLGQVSPAVLFLENVWGIVQADLQEMLSDLARVGFDAEWDVFSAREEGAPHIRERVFVLAHSLREGLEGHREKPSGASENNSPDLRSSWWTTEPRMDRVRYGTPYRVDRAIAAGNGVVPAMAARAWHELLDRAGWELDEG